MQSRRAVVQNDFKNGFAAAAKTLEPERDDFSARRERFVFRKFGNFSEMPAVFVTLGPVQQQIFNRENFQPRELRRAFRADAPERGDRIFQRRNFIFWRRHRPHDTNRSRLLQRQMIRRSRGDEAHFNKLETPYVVSYNFSRAGLKRVLESFDFAAAGAKR